MKKLLLIVRHTYWQNFWRGAFLFYNFGFPVLYALIAALMIGVTALSVARQRDLRPIGIVDLAQVVLPPDTWAGNQTYVMRVYADEDAAQTALQNGDIQAYYVIATDYLESAAVREVAGRTINPEVTAQLSTYLRDSLLATVPPDKRERIINGSILRHQTFATARDLRSQRWLELGVVAVLLGLFYLTSQFINSYLLEALHEERNDRTIEILLTSVTAPELITGKVAGLTLLGLTPFMMWGVLLGALTLGGLAYAESLGIILDMPWALIGLAALLIPPVYLLYANVLAMTGTVTGTEGWGPQIAGLVSGLLWLPWLPGILVAFRAPDSLAAIVLSIVPFTAPFVILTRATQITVPLWQTALAIALLWATTLISLPLSGRLYRAAWLVSGQKNRLRSLVLALRGK